MDPRFQLLMTVFIGVAAAALVVQIFLLAGLYYSAREARRRVSSFADRWEPVADSTWRTVEETRHQVKEISAKVQDIADSTRVQVARVDDLLTEVNARARTQMERLDKTLAVALDRVDETTAQLQHTILTPVREINAVAAGVRAVVEHLARRRRSTVEQATQDEALFI